jgi:hypothetical protein
MASTTIGPVFDRINSVVASQGFVQSRDPFSFDRQPDKQLDQCFRVESTRSYTGGYFGGDQEERHTMVIWVARKIRNNPHGAVRQVKVDMDVIEATINADSISATEDYTVLDEPAPTSDVQLPQVDATHVVGRLVATVDFDRDV